MRAESRQAAAQCCRHLEASGSERACRQPGAVGKRLLHPCLFRDEEQAVLRLGDRRMTTDTKLDSLGIFGASLFFGHGVITPAISVLSAVEGLEVVAPQLHAWIVPIVVMVLLAVFMAQGFGTEKVGKVFGPVTILWFTALAVLGVFNILHEDRKSTRLNSSH